MSERNNPPDTVRIALIEDDAVLRAQLTELLTASGSASIVYQTSSEQQAGVWLAQQVDQWDLAIIDVFIAQGNGLSLLGAHRHRLPGQRIVMLTGFATRETRSACQQLGADAVFDKLDEIDSLVAYCTETRFENPHR